MQPLFAPIVATCAVLALFALGWRGAVPRGRRRPVRLRVLLRALLPRRVIRSASGRLDIAAFLFARLFAGTALGWALVSGTWWAGWSEGWLRHAAGPVAPVMPLWAGNILVTVALFVAYDFAYWANHRLSHASELVWAFHKVHHSAESLSPLTNFRVHPVDTILFYNMAAAITGIVAGAMNWGLGRPVDPLAVGGMNLLVFLGTTILTHLQHSHLWIVFPGRWGRILMSPAAHQLHHSIDRRHHGRNFGDTLAIWDRLFGTLIEPTRRRERLAFGIPDPGYSPHGLKGALWMPFVEATALLRLAPLRRRQVALAE